MNSKILILAIVACVAQIVTSQTTHAPPTTPPTHAPTTPPTHPPTHAPTTPPTHPPTHAPTTPPTRPPTHAPTTVPPTKHVDPVTHPHTTPTTAKPTAAPTHATPPPSHPTPVPTHPTAHPTVPVTHLTPTPTKKPIQPPKLDPRLQNLTNLVTKLGQEVVYVDRTFELNAALGNTFELTLLLERIKKIKEQIQIDMVEIRFEIASNMNMLQTYGRRLALEFLRLQVEGSDRFLSQVGQTIMGSFGELNHFPTYVTSETLGIAAQLLTAKMNKVLTDVFEIDQLITDNQKANPTNPKIDHATKQKVDRDLQEIEQIGQAAKTEIAKDFYEEVEKIRLEGKELNIYQKAEFEMFIDILNYLIEYTRHFEDLFNRINN